MEHRRILVIYDTREGQTEEIAHHIARRARSAGVLADVFPSSAPPTSLEGYSGIVAGGSVHAGHHGKDLVRFVRDRLAALSSVPSAFFSVSLSAAGHSERNRADATRLMEQFLLQTGWTPTERATFAGALKYREYGFLKRWIMRRISKAEGGDTDTSRDYEYTDWEAVDRFTDAILARLGVHTAERGGPGEMPVASSA